MKVTNVKFIDRETGKVFLSLDQAEIEMVEKNGGQDEFISTFVRELVDIFYGGRVNVLLNRIPAQGNLFAFFGWKFKKAIFIKQIKYLLFFHCL